MLGEEERETKAGKERRAKRREGIKGGIMEGRKDEGKRAKNPISTCLA